MFTLHLGNFRQSRWVDGRPAVVRRGVRGGPALRHPKSAGTADPGAHGDVSAQPALLGHSGARLRTLESRKLFDVWWMDLFFFFELFGFWYFLWFFFVMLKKHNKQWWCTMSFHEFSATLESVPISQKGRNSLVSWSQWFHHFWLAADTNSAFRCPCRVNCPKIGLVFGLVHNLWTYNISRVGVTKIHQMTPKKSPNHHNSKLTNQ